MSLIDPLHDYDLERGTALLTVFNGEATVAVSERGSIRSLPAEAYGLGMERLELVLRSCIHVPTREVLAVDVPCIGDLVCEVEQVIRRHIVLACDEAYVATACWIVASHFFPVFTAFPLLYIGKAGYARGGTTFLSLVLALSPRPHMLVDPTPSYIMRVVELARPTVGIDEVTREDTRYLPTVLRLIRAGFHRGLRAGRALGGGTRVLSFSLYCPKAVVDPEGTIEQASTLSRGLRVLLARADSKVEVPDVLLFYDRYRELVSRLYAAYLHFAHEVRREYENILTEPTQLGLSGRGVQAYAPLLAVAKLCSLDIYRRTLDYVKRLDSERPGVEKVIILLATLLDMLESGEHVLRTSVNGDVYLDLTEVASRADRALRVSLGRRVYSTDFEHALRQVIPPASALPAVHAKRRILVFSRDVCRGEEECRQWLIQKLRDALHGRTL